MGILIRIVIFEHIPRPVLARKTMGDYKISPDTRRTSRHFDLIDESGQSVTFEEVQERRARATMANPTEERGMGAKKSTMSALFTSHKRMVPGMFEVREMGKSSPHVRSDGRRLSLYSDEESAGDISSLEEKPHKNIFPVISPYSVFRQAWDIMIASFVIYLTFKLPIQLAFDWESPGAMQIVDVFMDVFFYLDIVLNFRTGFVHGHELVMEPREIAGHYLRFWFWIDFLASFPSNIFSRRAKITAKFSRSTRCSSLLACYV